MLSDIRLGALTLGLRIPSWGLLADDLDDGKWTVTAWTVLGGAPSTGSDVRPRRDARS